jgi:uncharacterized membrane protein YuzA (DUF378 family)
MMKKLDLLAASLTILGGVNWLSVAAGKYDLLGKLAGNHRFGETNSASRALYGVVGGGALWTLSRLIQREVV